MRSVTILAATLAITGCASGERGYPSLAHRPIENGNFDEPVRAAPVLAPDAALDARIVAWTASLAAVTDAFDKALPAAEKRAGAAQGKPSGSDAWVEAQQGLATLDDIRARLAALASEIDGAAGDRAAKLEPPYPALNALHDRVEAETTRQAAAADRLQAMVAPS